jgi:hypothetical protein
VSGYFYKEWRTKAEVDYFPKLVVLWLSTNAWYRSHYSEITTRKDRDFLNKLRDDHSTRNKIYTRFDRVLSASDTKDRAELINTIEALSFGLNSTQLLWDEQNASSVVTFTNCLLSTNPKTYGSLVVKKRASGIEISGTLKLTEDRSALFNGFLEIIYQIRCQLVHGQLEPNDENHEVVKQCYFLLHLLMRI